MSFFCWSKKNETSPCVSYLLDYKWNNKIKSLLSIFYFDMNLMYYFKKEIEDFVVKEKLGFEPKTDGDFLYIYFEKVQKNTMDVIEWLCAETKLPRKWFGIAGLKDKHGITQQWMSISMIHVDRFLGGEEAFLKLLWKEVKVLKSKKYKIPLRVGQNIWNHFTIRLRKKPINKKMIKSQWEWKKAKEIEKEKSEIKKHILKKCKTIIDNGMPNFFGKQRFSKGFRNFWAAKEIIESGNMKEDYHVKFKLQTYGSVHFNRILKQRIDLDGKRFDGDVLVDRTHWFWARTSVWNNKKNTIEWIKLVWKEWWAPNENKWMMSGPIFGSDLFLPAEWSEAYEFEKKYIDEIGFWEKQKEVCKLYNLYGVRRALWIWPKDFGLEWDNDDLIFKFFLPTWSYATVLLWEIFEEIAPKMLQENKLGWAVPDLEE